MAEIDVIKKSFRTKSLPGPTIVFLWLSSYGSDDGRILLSSELVTGIEVDESVDYLIKQLEKARKKAKKFLKKM